MRQAGERKKCRRQRNDHPVSGHEGRDDCEAERWRAVENHIIKVAPVTGEGTSEKRLASHLGSERYLGTGHGGASVEEEQSSVLWHLVSVIEREMASEGLGRAGGGWDLSKEPC